MKTRIPPASSPRRTQTARLLAALLALSCVLPATALAQATDNTLQSSVLNYRIQGEIRSLPYSASGSLRWARQGQTYDARLEINVFLLASRIQHSEGRLTPEGLQPRRFTDRVRKDRAVDFDRTSGQLRFTEGTPATPIPAGVQDQLSIFMELGRQLSARTELQQAGTALVFPVAGVHGLDDWRFVVDGNERLRLPGGVLGTVKLTRTPPRPDALRAELWLAPALNWLPARIRLTQASGDTIDQQWRGSEAP
jgi:hypothetical protein